MSLVVRSVAHADVAQCVRIRVDSLGSLVIGRPPPYPGYVEEAEASLHKDIDRNGPHVRYVKVVDTENEGEVIACAKWELYEHGRPDLENLRKPMDEADKEVDHFGLLREAAHEYFCSRNGEMGKHPHLLLALLVTASQHRGRGAGSLLVRWGIELSEKTGLPCYLQASEQGRRLYAHHGFQDIDTVEFDLSKYGLEGVEKMTEMIREPSAVAKPNVVGSIEPPNSWHERLLGLTPPSPVTGQQVSWPYKLLQRCWNVFGQYPYQSSDPLSRP